MNIRPAGDSDHAAIWRILEPTIRAGETYALDPSMSDQDALQYWFAPAHEVFVAEDGGEIVGTYFLQRNQAGAGAHVANAGYMTAANQTGKGIARAMCEHSLALAKRRGFRAMQFNFVVSSNERAVKLWQQCGFEIVGTLPRAFNHPTRGYVDAFVMFRAV